MRDKEQLMVQFAKIVERYPEIYDYNSEGYKARQSDAAWEKVCSSVRTELQEECTVEELKIKWKGMRYSFNKCKSKLLNSDGTGPSKKYYLYDALQFLYPFVSQKGSSQKDSTLEGCGIHDDDESKSNGNIPSRHTNNSKKRKHSSEDEGEDDENEDLQFFKSILPDIRDFTTQERRKLKMGILRLINDLENERKQQ